MLSRIIYFSVNNKFIVFLLVGLMAALGVNSLVNLPIGAVPDITNNQVQVITTSNSLSTAEMEKYISYPIELEMANLPGVKEIRSTSKFGLSVVTVVFKDDLGTYLPRQLIAEKIQAASENIPAAYGKPAMGPISTGLGEIFQYILDVEEGYEDRYDPMDLRSIQDWIVKRQLTGIEGVVEVNTWGGYLKQYEVAITTHRLNALEISIQEVFDALENNNSVTGAGYIEKQEQSYFIRGEGLLSSIEDIENILVKNRDGLPVLIKDVAKVQFGYANRFGAITANGEGEKVMGQVMMLKGANPKAVIDAVKERVEEIGKSLPEGVIINPVLDRSELIDRTTFTISENLIFGCLIVIFVVVLLLGNWRSGLVVASVIPLSLLFALNMMYLFGIDANLMSLGAIDFGIIVDGAVIIVEYISFQLVKRNKKELSSPTKAEMDALSIQSSSKMMNSAFFGQLIILIVFIPILSLEGVEGKMFIPMALVFGFAIIGAMLLCLTYLPAASASFIKASGSKRSFSDKLISRLNIYQERTLNWGLANKNKVLLLCGALLVLTGLVFSRMGAEFVPTLDEGDFVIQPILKTGTSLSETIKMTSEIEKILIKKFPEVKQIVTRIGAAEVPTDPMSLEETDVIITLKDKSEWTTAETKDGLAEAFKEAIEVLGIGVEFTQPIEMRFNELITGVRSDIAIKLFGNNLEILDAKAQEIKALLEGMDGIGDLVVDKTAGLPQIQVKYNRQKLARYGLNVSELNDWLALSYAGKKAGVVFEEEERYDLVLRLAESQRNDITAIKSLYVDLPDGGRVPLEEVADIQISTGAAKISRENTRRRVVVAINVRNRDLQSLVEEIQAKLGAELDLPAGYNLTYGGQFENLNSAKSRLAWAVPLSLLLIFSMLYFAFGSWKEALLVFTAIPLSAIGGVFLLYLRDMPFSISAGIGFIALFGIAVLNGIVLIEHFKSIQEKFADNYDQLVIQGSKDRLRAVLLTAMAAALGFLPMAISTNAGAEVQRPLATVVVGGIMTSTLLTLVVLPILYAMLLQWTNRSSLKKGLGSTAAMLSLGFLLSFSSESKAQNQVVYSLEELKSMCVENNISLRTSSLQVDESKALINSSLNFDKTGVYYGYDENNLAINDEPISVWGVEQTFQFPTLYFSGKKVKKSAYLMQNKQHQLKKLQIEQQLLTAYQNLLFQQEKLERITYLDSIYRAFSDATAKSFEYGKTSYLQKLTASSKMQAFEIEVKKAEEEIEQARYALKALVLMPTDSFKVSGSWNKLPLNALKVENHPMMSVYEQRIAMMQSEYSYAKQQLLPDLSLNYFQGTNAGLNENLIGYQFGLKIPLLFSGQSSQIKAANISRDIIETEAQQFEIELKSKQEKLLSQLRQHHKALVYYEDTGLSLAKEIAIAAKKSYQAGEINFFRYLESEEEAMKIELNYLTEMHAYNQTVVKLNYLMND